MWRSSIPTFLAPLRLPCLIYQNSASKPWIRAGISMAVLSQTAPGVQSIKDATLAVELAVAQ